MSKKNKSNKKETKFRAIFTVLFGILGFIVGMVIFSLILVILDRFGFDVNSAGWIGYVMVAFLLISVLGGLFLDSVIYYSKIAKREKMEAEIERAFVAGQVIFEKDEADNTFELHMGEVTYNFIYSGYKAFIPYPNDTSGTAFLYLLGKLDGDYCILEFKDKFDYGAGWMSITLDEVTYKKLRNFKNVAQWTDTVNNDFKMNTYTIANIHFDQALLAANRAPHIDKFRHRILHEIDLNSPHLLD